MNFFYFDFTRPINLLLLLALVLIIYWHKNSLARMSPARKKAVLFIRAIIVILLVFALAGFRLNLPQDELTVLFAIDSSLSVSRENVEWAKNYVKKAVRNKSPRDKAGVIIFGKDAYLENSPTEKLKIDRFATVISPEYTNPARAIQLALAVFPENTLKRVVLITDGNENMGNAAEQAIIASARNVEIFCLPYPDEKFAEVLVDSLESPPEVDKNDAFIIKSVVKSNTSIPAIVNLYRNDNLVAREKVNLEKGKNLFTISQQIEKEGVYRYSLSVETSDDRFPDNNRSSTLVTVKGIPRILYLAGDRRQAKLLGTALKGQKILVEEGDVADLPTNLSALSAYKAVIFDNLNGLMLSLRQMQMIENYVKDLGGGFVMIGGDTSFGAGGYYNTPVERILPVSMDIRQKKHLPTIAMVLAIDKSGSMGSKTGDVEKMSLARESAIATVEILNPRDKIGVIGFDSASKWVYPLQYVGDKKAVIDDIASIRAGGGTNIYPALDSAYLALKETQAVTRHVIVLTDGRSAPGDFENLVKKMVADKITVSTVGVGKDADLPFLESLAKWGHGRFYYADHATYLPRIFVRETIMAGRNPILEEDFYPQSAQPAVFLTGIDPDKMPILHGYVATTLKPRASLALQTHHKDPLLAYWRIGLGKSVAFTSDDGIRWTKAWVDWADYSRFWTQMVRWVLPNVETDGFTLRTTFDGGRLNVSAEAVDEEGRPVNFLPLAVRVVSPSGKAVELPMEQTAPGLYRAQEQLDEVGTFMLNLVKKTRGVDKPLKFQPFSMPYSVEYKKFSNNDPLLYRISSITGGKVVDPSDNVFEKPANMVYYPRPAWIELLIAALLLFPLDVALRRLYLPAGFIEKIASFFSKKPVKDKVKRTIYMSTLKQRKEQIRQTYSTGKEKIHSLIKKASKKPRKSRRKEEYEVAPQKIETRKPTVTGKSASGEEKKRSTLSQLKKVKENLRKRKK